VLADALHAALKQREDDLQLEQAVYGLDSMKEVELHDVLAAGLGGYEVAREVHYPSTVGRKLNNRQRCDLVLTPPGSPLRLDSRPPTLFDPPNTVGPEQGLWLEIKIAKQYAEGNRPHRSYGAQWRQAVVKDLKKMEAETPIRQAALVLVVFNSNADVLAKDLELFEDVLATKEVLAGFRQVRTVPITERIGHTLATVAVWPTIQRPTDP
jgi:hypothetical protein